jgi:hypothetical protein
MVAFMGLVMIVVPGMGHVIVMIFPVDVPPGFILQPIQTGPFPVV